MHGKPPEYAELLRSDLVGSTSDYKSHGNRNRKQNRARSSWRVTVAGGAAVAFIVCAVNIGVLVWAKVYFPASDSNGITIVFTGSCAMAKRITLWVDFAVNVLSTLLLSASNHCAQVLSSPSRSDIDKAHAKGKWMDIGVPSVRNLAHIAKWRVALWAVLFLSSGPLHLLYNSVVFNTLSANHYQAALVTHDFLAGGSWNETKLYRGVFDKGRIPLFEYVEQLHYMQKHQSTLQRLESQECVQAYGNSQFESTYRSVLVVSNLTQSDNVVEVWSHSPTVFENDEHWFCNGRERFGTCNPNAIAANSSSWTIADVHQCPENTIAITKDWSLSKDCTLVPAKVEYCLAEYSPAPCTVRINTYLLLVVIGCNLLKIGCLTFTAFGHDFQPLATIGDAVASFLDIPEEHTKNAGPLSIMDVTKDIRESRNGRALPLLQFRPQPRRWARAVSITRWWLCITLCIACLAVSACLFVDGLVTPGIHISQVPSMGLGALSLQTLIGGMSDNLFTNVLLANTPQAVITVVYLLYNNALTCMVLAYEWGRFSQIRKPLRVSRPVPGSTQRSTFWLQLPYRFILPITALMATLHWLVGRSIFFVQLMPYDIRGLAIPDNRVDACAYSLSAILSALVVGGVLVLAFIGFSFFSLPSGMPVASSCSLAISAAAHPARGEEDAALHPVMYGILEQDPIDEVTTERVGFSSRYVLPLDKNKVYPAADVWTSLSRT